jgi:hypothetical protein
VTVESYPTLATHTAYHPTNLDAFGPSNRLPIVSWGNGACARNGTAFAGFLTHIASHGYLAVSIGPKNPPPGPAPAPTIDDQLLLDAIDWAIRQNGDRSSRFYDKLDTRRIAVMGQSCGGLQALAVSHDPRITTTVVWNSGALPAGSTSPALKQSAGNKESLTRRSGIQGKSQRRARRHLSPAWRRLVRRGGRCVAGLSAQRQRGRGEVVRRRRLPALHRSALGG